MANKHTIVSLLAIACEAENSSPFPWVADLENHGPGRVLATDPRQTIICESGGSSQNPDVQADMKFIATFNPAQVTTLLKIINSFAMVNPTLLPFIEEQLNS
jgi:hypothetical protein